VLLGSFEMSFEPSCELFVVAAVTILGSALRGAAKAGEPLPDKKDVVSDSASWHEIVRSEEI
jgi:hypothetical protein